VDVDGGHLNWYIISDGKGATYPSQPAVLADGLNEGHRVAAHPCYQSVPLSLTRRYEQS
jgi:hypothetical protein